MDAVALSTAWGSGTFRIPLLFLGLRRFGFVYLVWYAGRRAELMYVTTGITFWKLSSSSNNTHTHTFNDHFSGTTQVSQYQKGKTNLDFTEARDSE